MVVDLDLMAFVAPWDWKFHTSVMVIQPINKNQSIIKVVESLPALLEPYEDFSESDSPNNDDTISGCLYEQVGSSVAIHHLLVQHNSCSQFALTPSPGGGKLSVTSETTENWNSNHIERAIQVRASTNNHTAPNNNRRLPLVW